MREGLQIEDIKRLGNNLKSLVIKSDTKSVEIRKLGNIEKFFEYNNFYNFLQKGNIENEYIFKVSISLVLNGDKDDIDDVDFYILAKDNDDFFLTNEVDISNLNSGYYFKLYPYTEEYGLGEALGSIKVGSSGLRPDYFDTNRFLDGVLEYLFDLYKIT